MTGAELLLTGVTGFVGKVVLEELLRRRDELGITMIHVLIRPMGSSSAARFRTEVLASHCLSQLPDGWQRYVKVVSGELSEPHCGLSNETRTQLTEQITEVIHCAASVEFELPIRKAAIANITGSLNLLDFARSCTRLEKMVSVSTAYVTPFRVNQGPIEERLVDLPRAAESTYQSILNGTAREERLLAETGHPNTYTLTKCLAEHLLTERRGNVPLVIVRPSIVSATWRYPFPGWIDSYAAFAGFVAAIGGGHMRALAARPREYADIIPCDEVATRIIDSAFEHPTTPPNYPDVRHAVAGMKHACRIELCGEVISDFYNRHPIGEPPQLKYMGPRSARFRIRELRHHRARGAVTRTWYGMSGQVKKRRAAGRVLERLVYLNRAFSYFSHHTFDFRSSMPFDDPSFEPATYLHTVCSGVYRHLFQKNETEMSFAGRRDRGDRRTLRWVTRQPNGNWAIRSSAYAVTKALHKCSERVTFDLPSFEAARDSAPENSLLVIIPSHRSYMDFVLCSYLFFARPDLRIGLPYIAAAAEFSRVPVLGRLFRQTQAFYLKRGQGQEDEDLTRQVHALIARKAALQFFIEGSRSRSRQFLPPRRGLLRCLQATGETCTILPVALTYDRVPEEAAFLGELRGEPKPEMRLRSLLAWATRLTQGKVNLGRIHVACGDPLRLDPSTDIHQLSHAVVAQLQAHTATTTHHLRCFLSQHPIDGVTVRWLSEAIMRRGGRVLESRLHAEDRVSSALERCMRYQWMHLFYPEARAAFPNHPAIQHHVARNFYAPPVDQNIEAALDDPKVRLLLRALFEPVCLDYVSLAESLGTPPTSVHNYSPKQLVRHLPEAHLPCLEDAFEDLIERGILTGTGDNGGSVWGPNAADIQEYALRCRWPEAADPADDWSAALAVGGQL